MTIIKTPSSNIPLTLPKDDVRLELRIKNNLLYTAIMERYRSIEAFCHEAQAQGYSIYPSTVGQILNFKASPFVNGDPTKYKTVCLSMERMLGIPAEDLFPIKLYKKLGINQQIILFNSAQGPLALANRQPHLIPAGIEFQPGVQSTKQELQEQIKKALKTLTERERSILELRFGFSNVCTYTVEECSKIFKISDVRVRQVINTALRKLQQPLRAKILYDFLSEKI